MIDPAIETILWHLLGERLSLTLEDVCWWDSGRAQVAILAAGMLEDSPGRWVHGPDTAEWYEETWKEIRRAAPNAACACHEIDGFNSSDGFDEATAAQETPAALAAARRGAAVDET